MQSGDISIRLMVGGMFLVEGSLKLLYPADLAAGRCAKIEILSSEGMGPFAASVETVCGRRGDYRSTHADFRNSSSRFALPFASLHFA